MCGGGAPNFGINGAGAAGQLELVAFPELNTGLRSNYTAYGAAAAEPAPWATRSTAAASMSPAAPVHRSRKPSSWSPRQSGRPEHPGHPRPICRSPTDVSGGIEAGATLFDRLDVELKGEIDRTYQDSVFTDGSSADNDDYNFDQYSTQLRAGYELSPAVKPFVEIDADRRQHDLAADRFGIERGSQGRAVKIRRPPNKHPGRSTGVRLSGTQLRRPDAARDQGPHPGWLAHLAGERTHHGQAHRGDERR